MLGLFDVRCGVPEPDVNVRFSHVIRSGLYWSPARSVCPTGTVFDGLMHRSRRVRAMSGTPCRSWAIQRGFVRSRTFIKRPNHTTKPATGGRRQGGRTGRRSALSPVKAQPQVGNLGSQDEAHIAINYRPGHCPPSLSPSRHGRGRPRLSRSRPLGADAARGVPADCAQHLHQERSRSGCGRRGPIRGPTRGRRESMAAG